MRFVGSAPEEEPGDECPFPPIVFDTETTTTLVLNGQNNLSAAPMPHNLKMIQAAMSLITLFQQGSVRATAHHIRAVRPVPIRSRPEVGARC